MKDFIKNLPWTESVKDDTEKVLNITKIILQKNPIILECGSHNGEDTVRFKQQWPNSIIYEFEAHPISFQNCKKTTETLKDIYTYNFALSNKNENIIFYKSQSNPLASSIFPDNIGG